MSKGLEALERIIGCSTIESHTKKWQQDYLVVEKELKEKEELAQALSIVTCENGDLLKYKRALEIIKEKEVRVWYIKCQTNIEQYNAIVNDEEKLTQEEYDLLKEVLL